VKTCCVLPSPKTNVKATGCEPAFGIFKVNVIGVFTGAVMGDAVNVGVAVVCARAIVGVSKLTSTATRAVRAAKRFTG